MNMGRDRDLTSWRVNTDVTRSRQQLYAYKIK
jgi:hypothetical protein